MINSSFIQKRAKSTILKYILRREREKMGEKQNEDEVAERKNKLPVFVTAIDWSGSKEFPRHIYSLVSVEETKLPKVTELLVDKLRVKHWERLTSREKTIYTEKFLRKWEELKLLLYRVDIKYHIDNLVIDNDQLLKDSKVVILDDSLYNKFLKNYPFSGRVILESKSRGPFRALMLLADNIANILRRLLRKHKKDIKKRWEIERMFKK